MKPSCTQLHKTCLKSLRFLPDIEQQQAPETYSSETWAIAAAGMDIVFHCAAAAPSASNAIGNEKLMRDVNVLGTEHVIAACRALGVAGLVYTSSASVVFEGRDLLNVDESIPVAKKPMDFYTSTKVCQHPGLGFGSLPSLLKPLDHRCHTSNVLKPAVLAIL